MDSSKAKKAKTKAKARTKASQNNAAQQQMLQQAALQGMAAQSGGINPEVQAQQIAMQNQTQTVNPYHRMGSMPPNLYNPGNVVHGGYVPGSY